MKMMNRIEKTLTLTILATGWLLAGCGSGGREEADVYEVPAEPIRNAVTADTDAAASPGESGVPMVSGSAGDGQPEGAAPANAAGGMVILPGMAEQNAGVDAPQWQVPESWTVLEPTPIRLGNFTAGRENQVEITVTTFPGTVGGLESNIARWQNQIGWVPGEADAVRKTEEVSLDGSPATLVRLDNPATGQAIIGLIYFRTGEGRSWFFKMSGPREAVLGEEPIFRDFLDTVAFGTNN